ncbi:MAG: hypothetical protein IK143_03620 [Bacteroidales bacterium]|nr:hypothetical protein [Bacteroidales bacterium]
MKKRYIPLDILRGLTITFMCIVNNPGSWSKAFAPLKHAPWDGCTPTDLVYPFFIFCMGCAMAFSFAKYDGLSREAASKLLKRGILIFGVGLLLALYPFYPYHPHDESWSFWQNYGYWLGNKRIMGVLQRIACSYVLAGLLVLALKKDAKKIGIAMAALCAVYTLILVIFGEAPGPFTLEGNFARKVDLALLGANHMYSVNGIAFDPEGLLGSLTGACTALLGFLIGDVAKRSDSHVGLSAKLFATGFCLIAAGLVISIWVPINKSLWSASYVLYAGGWSTIALAMIGYLVDVRGYGKWFEPAKAMGMNALTAFVMAGLIVKTFGWIGWAPNRYFAANGLTSLVYSLLFVSVIFSILWVMYKKNIVVKL